MALFGWGYVGMHIVGWRSPWPCVLIMLGSFVPAALVAVIVGSRRCMAVAVAFAWLAYGAYPLYMVGVPYEAFAVVAALLVGGAVVVYGRAELRASAGEPFKDPISTFMGDDDD